MGLNFSHCDAKWGYIRFNSFRERLASEIGVALNCMESFATDMLYDTRYQSVRIYGFDVPNLEQKGLIGQQAVITWDKVKDDIKPLLHHSDCDGVLTPDECRKVAPRLRELVRNWEDCYDKNNALSLADGMDYAASRYENLEFL